jgi:hypothetical protein
LPAGIVEKPVKNYKPESGVLNTWVVPMLICSLGSLISIYFSCKKLAKHRRLER